MRLFPFPISTNWIFFILSAVLTTVWPARAARLSVQRVVLKLAFGKLRKFDGIDAIPSFENLRNGDHLAVITFSSLLD